jgi:hypothetical protein
MASNRGVVYLGPGKVEVQSIDDPRMQAPNGRDIDHGASRIRRPIGYTMSWSVNASGSRM